MNLNEITWEDVELIHATADRDAQSDTLDEQTDSVLKLGQPVILDAFEYLKMAGERDPALNMLKDESDFYYLRIPVSVRPTEKISLRLLSVDIQLLSVPAEAIAWSMQPEKVEQQIKTKVDLSITSGLKFKPVELSSKVGESDEFVIYEPSVEAFNLGTNEPAWEFRATSGQRISGIQLLHLIVQQPKNSRTSGVISLKGDLEDGVRLFKIFGRGARTQQSKFEFEYGCPA